MIDFTKPMKKNNKLIKQVQGWIEDVRVHAKRHRIFSPLTLHAYRYGSLRQALPDDNDLMVMVNEMQCFEPDCAPLETVCTLLGGPQSIVFKIFKPIAEVVPAEVVHAMQQALAGVPSAEHLNISQVQEMYECEDE